jgi:hypothetical protein
MTVGIVGSLGGGVGSEISVAEDSVTIEASGAAASSGAVESDGRPSAL